MGNVKFTSHTKELSRPPSEVYTFLSDLNHFESMMPDQVVDWKSTADTCVFTIKGLTTIGLKIKERIPDKLIKVESDGQAPVEFELNCVFAAASDNKTHATIELDAELSPMLRIMASSPLQNLVDIMADKLAAYLNHPGQRT
jgi:carbon monoxide dehydrogenase subunit G